MEDISFDVAKGEIFGFLGPNGAGKSTTIRCLLGLIKPSGGSAEILGSDMVKNHLEIMKRVGYMPSETQFYPSMKVSEVIKFAADVRGVSCQEEAARLMEECGVGDKMPELKKWYDAIRLPRQATAASAGCDFFMPFSLNFESGSSFRIATGVR